MNSNQRKCIVRSKTGWYSTGSSIYAPNFAEAKIYNYGELPKSLKEDEIIFLDSFKGLSQIVNEFEEIGEKIGFLEYKLNNLRAAKENLLKMNAYVVIEYFERLSELEGNSKTPLEKYKKELLLKEIISKNENNK